MRNTFGKCAYLGNCASKKLGREQEKLKALLPCLHLQSVAIMHAEKPTFKSFAHLALRPLTLSFDIFSFSLSESARVLRAESRGCSCVSVQPVEDKCALGAQ